MWIGAFIGVLGDMDGSYDWSQMIERAALALGSGALLPWRLLPA